MTIFPIVANVDFECSLPRELLPDHILRRAADAEVPAIRETLRRIAGFREFMLPFERLRSDMPEGETRALPYHVIERSGSAYSNSINAATIELSEAGDLLGIPLAFPVYISPDAGTGIGWYSGFDPLPPLDLGKTKVLGDADVDRLIQTHQGLRQLQAGYPDLYRSVEILRTALHLPGGHTLQDLGMFASLESLLTHSPHGEWDSITRQIYTKIELLSSRLASRIDYSMFRCDSPKTIWSRLYTYRSQIAHGGTISFASSQSILVDRKTVNTFILGVCRQLLLHALVEPQLIVDLRQC